MKKAVCVVVEPTPYKVIGVSRKNNSYIFGLPGGKVDEDSGERALEAAVRELREETGLVVEPWELVPVYVSSADGEFETTAYLLDYKAATAKTKAAITCFKRIQPNKEGVADWVTWRDLFEGPFGQYNKNLFAHIRTNLLKQF